MSYPCPIDGGIITLNVGSVPAVGKVPVFLKSTTPNVYPDPPLVTVIDSTLESLLVTIVHFAPVPSPLMGMSVYTLFLTPTLSPRLVMVTTLI